MSVSQNGAYKGGKLIKNLPTWGWGNDGAGLDILSAKKNNSLSMFQNKKVG
jgi:hypothetical protein